MAEVVQLHIEDLLAGFKCLEDETVFTNDEIQTIVKNIQNHEYKLQRSVKEKETNLKYINYLQCVLQLVQKRYDQLNVVANEEVRHMLIKKIKTEFRKLRDRHQRDVRIWLSFINFCKRNNHKDYVGKLYHRMLQVLPDKPELWISSAKWFLEEQNSWDLARNAFKNGLRFNPTAPELFIEFFRFELLYIEIVLKRKQMLSEGAPDGGKKSEDALYDFLPESHIENDSILGGKIAMVIFRQAIDQIGIGYAMRFLEILEDFSSYSFSKDLKAELLDHMKTHHAESEETWDIVARTCTSESNNHKRFKITDQEYKNALERFANERMWQLYLANLLDNLKLNLGGQQEKFYLDKLEQELTAGVKADLVSRRTFVELIEKLDALKCSNSYNQQIIRLGLDKWQKDVAIWHFKLKTLVACADQAAISKLEILALFNRALRIVSQNPEEKEEQFRRKLLDFIRLFIEWAVANLSERELIKIIEANCTMNVSIKDLRLGRSIVAFFKPILLEQLSRSKDGQTRRRQAFEKYKLMNPITKEFYVKMIELETDENLDEPAGGTKQKDVRLIRKVFNEMLGQFGRDDHRLWLDFCRFELKHGAYVEIARIYEIAKKQLSPSESDLFVQNYSLLHKNLSA